MPQNRPYGRNANGRTFELYYAHGGHGGPHNNLFRAVRWAFRMLKGSKTETRIVIRDRAIPDPTKANVYVLERTRTEHSEGYTLFPSR